MPNPAGRPSSLRSSWRSEQLDDNREYRKQLAIRLTFTLLTIGSAALFAYLVFTPLFHPKTRFFVLSAGSNDRSGSADAPFVRQDAVKFLRADGSFEPGDIAREFTFFESPTSVRDSLQQIVATVTDSSEILVLRISAAPYMSDDRPYFQCDNFDPDNSSEGIISVQEVVEQLAAAPASTVLLLWEPLQAYGYGSDAAWTSRYYSAASGVITNASGGRVFVLAACSPGEQSYTSESTQGSIFVHATVGGFGAQSDVNRDRLISLEEFLTFTATEVQRTVKRESAGAAEQTPILLNPKSVGADSGRRRIIAGAPSATAAELAAMATNSGVVPPLPIPVPGADPEKAAAEKEAAEKAETGAFATVKSAFRSHAERVKNRAVDDLNENLDSFPKFLRTRIKTSIGLELDPYRDMDPPGAQPDAAAAKGEPAKEPDASDVASKPAGSPENATELSAQTVSPPKDAPDIAQATSSGSSNMALIKAAWQFIETREADESEGVGPVDLVPHVWNAWSTYISHTEQAVRSRSLMDADATRVSLISELAGFYQASTTNEPTVGTWARRIQSELPDVDVSPDKCRSFGFSEHLAAYSKVRLPAETLTLIESFDRTLRNEDGKDFEKLISELSQQQVEQFSELHLARLLVEEGDIPWSVTQKTLQLHRRLERAAADPMATNFAVNVDLLAARSEVWHATRTALDQIDSRWQSSWLELTQSADMRMVEAEQNIRRIARGWHVRNQAMSDLPGLLNWRNVALRRLGNRNLSGSLNDLLDRLKQLDRLLEQREKSQPAEIELNADLVQSARGRMISEWNSVAESLVQDRETTAASGAWVLDSLLTVRLAGTLQRRRLLDLTQDKLRSSSFDPGASNVSVFRPVDQQESELLSVALNEESELQRRLRALCGLDETGAEHILPTLGMVAALTAEPTESTTARLLNLRRADRMTRLLSPEDSAKLEAGGFLSELWRIEFQHRLAHLLQSAQQTLRDATTREIPFLLSMHSDLREALTSLGDRSAAGEPLRLEIATGGSSDLNLTLVNEAEGEVKWRNLGGNIEHAWIVVDYDPQLIELEPQGEIAVHKKAQIKAELEAEIRRAEQELVKQLVDKNSAKADSSEVGWLSDRSLLNNLDLLKLQMRYPMQPVTGGRLASVAVSAGQTISIGFRVRRIGIGDGHAKLIWRLVTEDEDVRHEVRLRLPKSEKLKLRPDIYADGWSESDEGIIIHPWPNRPTDFRLGLRNEGGRPRDLSVQVLSPVNRMSQSLPDGFVSAELSRELENRLGQVTTVAAIPSVTVDSSGTTQWLQLQASAPDAAAVPAPPKPAENEPATKNSYKQGLIAVMTDKSTGDKLWRHIDFQVRHPRSYIEHSVRYDSTADQLSVRLKAANSIAVPKAGIPVRGRILESLPPGTEQALEGTITGAEGVDLYCRLAAPVPESVTLAIDIDGLPRALVFHISCLRTQSDIPPAADAQRIRITKPETGATFGPKDTQRDVSLEIDAVASAFKSRRDFVEVGWDIDRDREFQREQTVKISGDRSVRIQEESILGDRFTVLAEVEDLKVTLPTPQIQNARVNLLARLSAGSETVWSDPIEVIVDSDPPKITGVELRTPVLQAIGEDIQLRVGTDDAGLSGTSLVDVSVDTAMTGKWVEGGQVFPGEKIDDGTWLVNIPTKPLKPGRTQFLIRAKDRVENVSEVAKVQVELVSPERWAELEKQAVQDVTGSFVYRDQPLSSAKIQLFDEKNKPVYQAVTNDQGIFKVTGVKTGKYKLTAVGVAKNRPRIHEREIEVLPPPAAPLRLQLQAK